VCAPRAALPHNSRDPFLSNLYRGYEPDDKQAGGHLYRVLPLDERHQPREGKDRTEGPPLHRAHDRTARSVTKEAKPTFITAKTEPSANRMLLPPPSSATQLEPKNGVATGSGTPEQPTVGLAPNSNSRTIQEQVAAAIAVAKRRTVAALPAARDPEPVEGRPPNKKERLVAIVVARPEIRSVSDLEGKNVAMDEEYSESRNDILVAFVVAGGRATATTG
jgi:hypothetical protein